MAVTKPKGKPTGLRSTGGLNRPLKMVKMIQARCRICSPMGQGKRGWYETCPHDPYNHFEVVPGTPVMQEILDDDGNPTGEYESIPNPKKKHKKVPNWKQIADDPKVASGRMIAIQLERGSKFPEEFGYAPICDYFNCWEPANPKYMFQTTIGYEGIQTVIGKYHTRDEAAIMRLRLEATPIYLGLDTDLGRRRAQLRDVNLEE
jgi:hypothetical protein